METITPFEIKKEPLVSVLKTEWTLALQNQLVVIPGLKKKNQVLETRVQELERALERASDKYTSQIRLIHETNDNSSSCTLIFVGLLLLGAYCIPLVI